MSISALCRKAKRRRRLFAERIGQGLAPGVVNALAEGGYDGILCVEIDLLKDTEADKIKAVADAVSYLRTLVGNT